MIDGRQGQRVLALTAAALVLGVGIVPLAHAEEQAWVRAEIRLNLRSGPGTQYRIIGTTETGDGVRVLDRTKGWTKIRLPDGKEGWIPAGYLQPEPPPTVRLEQLEREVEALRAQLETLSAERERLAATNEQLSTADAGQREEIERLTFENMQLRAGQRWPEWIAGAVVLSIGMLLGALLYRSSARRGPSQRIRL